jgi:hypothetical protein
VRSEHTLNTLRYADRVKELGGGKKQSESKDNSQQQQQQPQSQQQYPQQSQQQNNNNNNNRNIPQTPQPVSKIAAGLPTDETTPMRRARISLTPRKLLGQNNNSKPTRRM